MTQLPLRQKWKDRTKNDAGFFLSAPARFIEQHGATAQFYQIALDSERKGQKRLYYSQPYAIFEISARERVVFTVDELVLLKNALSEVQNRAARANMDSQIIRAQKNYEACQPALQALMGRVRDIGSGAPLKAWVLKAVK